MPTNKFELLLESGSNSVMLSFKHISKVWTIILTLLIGTLYLGANKFNNLINYHNITSLTVSFRFSSGYSILFGKEKIHVFN